MKVEPSGVILRDICEIQTEKCIARVSPASITAVWSLPGRRQINVCRPCLDEMVRRGEWEVKGARLRRRLADIAIFDKEGRIKLIAEVKFSFKENSATRTSEIRHNLFAHSGLPNTPFLLIAFPDYFYLWKEENLDMNNRPADYQVDAKSIVKVYADKHGMPSPEMSPLEFELLVSQWLKDITNSTSSTDTPEWATKSGLYNAIKGGSVAMEVSIRFG